MSDSGYRHASRKMHSLILTLACLFAGLVFVCVVSVLESCGR